MVESEIIIDETHLDNAALSIPKLHSKYLNMLHNSQMLCVKLKQTHDDIFRERYLHYRNDHNIVFKSKAELDIMCDGDDDIQNARLKLEYEKGKAAYLEAVIKQINNLGFLVRDVIEWRKFQAGAY